MSKNFEVLRSNQLCIPSPKNFEGKLKEQLSKIPTLQK
jgi:hypothetical protein